MLRLSSQVVLPLTDQAPYISGLTYKSKVSNIHYKCLWLLLSVFKFLFLCLGIWLKQFHLKIIFFCSGSVLLAPHRIAVVEEVPHHQVQPRADQQGCPWSGAGQWKHGAQPAVQDQCLPVRGWWSESGENATVFTMFGTEAKPNAPIDWIIVRVDIGHGQRFS